MHPDLILFGALLVAILSIALVVAYRRKNAIAFSPKWIESVNYLGQLSLALGLTIHLIELKTALESMTGTLSIEQIKMGIVSTVHSAIHGAAVYLISVVLYAVLKLTVRN